MNKLLNLQLITIPFEVPVSMSDYLCSYLTTKLLGLVA